MASQLLRFRPRSGGSRLAPGSALWRSWEATKPKARGLRTALVLGPLLLFQPTPAGAQATGYGQPLGLSNADRQMFGNGSGGGSASPLGGGSSGLDVSNPIDLINRLRRSSAMDDATPPSSAVDQALKALEAQASPAPATSGAPIPAKGIPAQGAAVPGPGSGLSVSPALQQPRTGP